jgi:hypothetical protein
MKVVKDFIQECQKHLIDLSKRNRLINFDFNRQYCLEMPTSANFKVSKHKDLTVAGEKPKDQKK